MKVAILTDGIYPFVIGGMQKHSYYLTRFLVKLGVDVTLIHCVPHGETLIPHERVVHAMHLLDDKNFKSICLNFPRADWFPGHYVKESYRYSIEVCDALGKPDGYDFIYAKGFSAWHLIHLKSQGKIQCPPIGVKFHGYEMFQPAASLRTKLEHFILRNPVKFNNKEADYVFSYGGKITPIVESLGVPTDRIVEIPTGIESDWCIDKPNDHSGRKRHFLFVGRYERRKGIEELNAALRKMAPGSDFVFHFIGPIPDKKKLRGQKFVYHGTIMEKAGIQQIMDTCSVLVTPSHSEGMPNVIMEGMSRGLAVIATDVGAVCDQVDEQVGWLIAPADKNALQGALKAALAISDNNLMTKRQAALDKVRDNFTWEQVAKTTVGELEHLISKG